MSEDEAEQRIYMTENEKYRNTANARFALKHIKEEYYLNHDSEEYAQAARYMMFYVCRFTNSFHISSSPLFCVMI